MPMEFNEAVSHAKHMQRFFHAFEKVGEVLKTAARAEQVAAEALAAKVKLDEEIAVLSRVLGDQRDREEELDASLSAMKAKVESYKAGSTAELKASLDAMEKEKEASLAEVKKGLAAEIEALEVRRGEARKMLAVVEAEIATLQQKIGGIR